jgi:hypothetical protein
MRKEEVNNDKPMRMMPLTRYELFRVISVVRHIVGKVCTSCQKSTRQWFNGLNPKSLDGLCCPQEQHWKSNSIDTGDEEEEHLKNSFVLFLCQLQQL